MPFEIENARAFFGEAISVVFVGLLLSQEFYPPSIWLLSLPPFHDNTLKPQEEQLPSKKKTNSDFQQMSIFLYY